MRLNHRGEPAMGQGGLPGSVNGQFVPDGMGPHWFDNNGPLVVYPSLSRPALMAWDQVNPAFEVWPRGANDLAAGGGVWATWLAGFGLYISTNVHLPLAGLLGVGPTGEVAYTPDRQAGVGAHVRELNGDTWELTTGIVYDLQLLGNFRAIWTFQQNVFVHGIPHPSVLSGGVWRPRVAERTPGEYWNCYFSGQFGVVLHPLTDASSGYVIVPPGVDAFLHDVAVVNGRIKIAWSARAGELPEDYRERVVDVVNEPRMPFDALSDPVVAIGRKHWLAFFEGYPGAAGGWDTNDDPPTPMLPRNSMMMTPDGKFLDNTGKHVGTFIHGSNAIGVSGVESQAWQIAPTGKVPIAYWDDNVWTQGWPQNLPGMSWLCIRAYCPKDKTPQQFEADVRAQIADPNRPKLPLVLVPGNYDNPNLTTNLKGVVAMCSRIARDTPDVICTLVFNGTGRKGGLQNHHEVIPSWQEYFNGITGTPTGGETPMLDWAKVHEYGVRRWAELDVQNKSQQIVNTGGDCRKFQQDCFVQIAQELYWNEGVHFDLFWKHGVPDFNNPADVAAKLEHIGEDIIVDTPNMQYKDVVVSMGIPSASWNASGGTSPVTPGDEHKCAPPPKIDGTIPEPEPDPTIKVEVHGYDSVCSRSNPQGCAVLLEVSASHAQVGGRITAWLEGSGEKKRPFRFETLEDMHFFRGLRWKFGVPGTWPLIVEVKADDGRTARSDGSHMISVIP